MVTNSFGNRNFLQPMGRRSMHSKCLVFFFFSFKFWVRWGGGVGMTKMIFCHFSFVPNMFPSSSPMGSQYIPLVPNVFPLTNMV